MLKRLIYAGLLGLVGAGIVHIAILLLLPSFSERDAWSKLAAAAPLYTPVRAGAGAVDLLQSPDPLFEAAACRFDLADGVARLTARGLVPYWSVSVYDRDGDNVYSLNDRTATADGLDLVIATPGEMTSLRKSLPAEFRSSVFVEVPIDDGMVVVRSFVPDDSFRPGVSAFLGGLTCLSRPAEAEAQ